MKKVYLLWFVLLTIFLGVSSANAQEVAYQPKLITNSFTDIKAMLKQELPKFLSWNPETTAKAWWKNQPPKHVEVYDDRMVLTYKRNKVITFYFKNLENYHVNITAVHWNIGTHSVTNYEIKLGDFIIYFNGPRDGRMLADCLFKIRYQLMQKKIDNWLDEFKPVAEKYRSLKEKPAIKEQQREYVVQANLFTRQKNYPKAIGLFQAAIKLNNTSYPPAYYNLALLFANVNNYQGAIYYMKKYLMLEPDAKDARAAQDKIYEWKALINAPD